MTSRHIPTVHLLLVLLLMGMTGCAGHIKVAVDAISDPAQPLGDRHYVWVNTNPDPRADDLLFREFSQHFQRELQQRGYVLTTDPKRAALEIRFSYGVSGGQTGVYTYAWPVYQWTGGEYLTIRETTSDGSGPPTTTTRTIQLPIRQQQVGTTIETRRYTEYTHFAMVEARTIARQTGTDSAPMWKTVVTTISESDDLRRIMPFLARAAGEYLGANTQGKTEVKLPVDAAGTAAR